MLSNGVTASNDSVAPAPKPAITVAGPDTLPSASASMFLYASNATNPVRLVSVQLLHDPSRDALMPAFSELPMIRVVQPAYHCLPNGGHGSFFPSANLRLSCDRVFATSGRSGTWIRRGYFRVRTFGGVCYCYAQSVGGGDA
jgi:hypothetical protein